jgi:hypothetical protein
MAFTLDAFSTVTSRVASSYCASDPPGIIAPVGHDTFDRSRLNPPTTPIAAVPLIIGRIPPNFCLVNFIS